MPRCESKERLIDNEQQPHRDEEEVAERTNGDDDDEGFVGTSDDNSQFSPAIINDDYNAYHNEVRQRQQQLECQQQQRDVIMHDTTPAPLDRFYFTYAVFYLLGLGTMTPWNFFVTAEDYWMYKFRNTTNNATIDTDLTPMQKSFACDLTLTASLSGTTFLILHAMYGHHFKLRLKILGTLGIILIVFIITTVFVEINTDQWQEQFFLITLCTVIVINISSATMSGAIFGVCGLFPSQYMTALVSGQALGGIFTALALIMVLALDVGPKATAFIYFIIGSALIFMCIMQYVLLERRPFFQHYLNGGGGEKWCVVPADKQPSSNTSPTPVHVSAGACNVGVPLEPNLQIVFGKIYVHAVGICLLYTTTLSIYPAVSELMQSQNYGNGKAWNDVYYMPVVNYLFFNSGDYFGRILAGIWERPRSNPHTVLLMIILRMLYIPFFLCANTNVHQFLPVLVHSDLAFMIMILSFATLNGYLTNILLIMAPRQVHQHEKELASSIMAASLSCGLALGSILSMMFVQLL